MRNNFHTFILGLPFQYRGSELEKSLDDYEVYFTRVNGIEPSQLDSLGVRAISISPRFSIIPPMTPNEICCAYGHKLIYSKLIENSNEWSLVLEDDAILRINPKLVNLEKLDPSIPAIVQLSPNPLEREFSSSDLFFSGAPDTTLVEIESPQLESCAYFINRSAVQLILKRVPLGLISSRADWPLEARTGIRFNKTKEFCAYQIKTDSVSLIRDSITLIAKVSLVHRLVRILYRVFGITALLYKFQGAPFFAAYRAEVSLPFSSKFRWPRS